MGLPRVWLILPVACLAALACLVPRLHAGEEGGAPRVVKVEGVGKCYNYSRSFGLWGAVPLKGRPGRLLVRDGDVLAARQSLTRDAEAPVFTVYRAEDGDALALELREKRLLLAGKTVGLALSRDEDERGGWEWLKGAAADELASVRCVAIFHKLDEADLPLIRKLAAARPDADLVLDEDAGFRQVVPLFRPRRILAPGTPLGAEQAKLLASQPSLETLWIKLGGAGDVGRLAFLPRLRRLVVADWRPEAPQLFAWECRRLQSLGFFDCHLESLSAIEHLTELRELYLAGNKGLSDIRALAEVKRLEALMLAPSEAMADLAPLRNLPGLKWLSLSGEPTQEQFAAALAAAPKLETLEILGGEGITDLAPVKELDALRSLVFLGTKAGPGALHELKGLRLLILPVEAFPEMGKADDEARAAFAALEKALPDTTLAAGQLCLGSGWILLLVPLVLAGWLFLRRRSRLGGRHA